MGVSWGRGVVSVAETRVLAVAWPVHGRDGTGRVRAILPPPITEAGVWPYKPEQSDQHAEFIIGVADDGSAITHRSDPDALANYFGANESAPHYLTPV